MLIDSMAGGCGAFGDADGVDSAGMTNAPAAATANVEKNEYLYPMLYLWRRETADSGGPGRFRGGVGGEHAYVIHGSSGDFACTLFAHGVEQPTSAGMAGGEPGAPNGFTIHRGGRDVRARRRDELAGTLEVPPPKANLTLHPDDVFIHWYAGGGGYGDPFDRDPQRVLADARDGKVTGERAATHYGVVIDEVAGELLLDVEATAARRTAARPDGVHTTSDTALTCRHCGTALGTIIDEATCEESPVIDEWPVTALQDGAKRFVLRRYHCPGCASQVHTEIDVVGTPLVAPVVLAAKEAS
jgi:N-methylhydantoinase B